MCDQLENQLLVGDKVKRLFQSMPCTRLLLVNPPQLPLQALDITMAKNRRYFAYPPYGLGILASHAISRGYEVKLLDLNATILSYLHDTESSAITGQGITSAWQSLLSNSIHSFAPDVLCISNMFTTTLENLYSVAAEAKATNCDIPIIAGGIAVTVEAEKVLRESLHIDLVALFEAEISLCNLLDFINGKSSIEDIKQVATLIDDRCVQISLRDTPHGAEIDIAPTFPGLSIGDNSNLGEVGAYRFWLPDGTRTGTVLSNRGCRGRCSFCSVRSFYGPGVRSRSVEAVLEEISSLHHQYGINHIMWLDDDFLFDKHRALSLMNGIVRRNLPITWDATNGIIASAVSEELICAAAESGCIGLHLGIESGDRDILRNARKPSTLEHFLDAAAIIGRYPQIFTKGFLIIGFPGETVEQILNTISFARQLALDWYTVQLLCPLPGTEIYHEVKASTNSSKGNEINFGTSQMGRQRRIEIEQKSKAVQFDDLFAIDRRTVPSREMLSDIWFHSDYRINYERILNERAETQLNKWYKLLVDVADRMTVANPLANLFLGIIEQRRGNQKGAMGRIASTEEFLASSSYWQHRFSVLGINTIRHQLKEQLCI